MIFVTLGTQDKQFTRLLKDIQNEISKGNIKDRVIVQAGTTKYKSNDMEIFDLLDKDEFDKLMASCDLLITHGGVGSILTGLKHNKKVIACPRLSKYNEHLNDHQLQIIERFGEQGLLLPYNEGDDLGKILKGAKSFKPNKYQSNTNNMVELIKKFIEQN